MKAQGKKDHIYKWHIKSIK